MKLVKDFAGDDRVEGRLGMEDSNAVGQRRLSLRVVALGCVEHGVPDVSRGCDVGIDRRVDPVAIVLVLGFEPGEISYAGIDHSRKLVEESGFANVFATPLEEPSVIIVRVRLIHAVFAVAMLGEFVVPVHKRDNIVLVSSHGCHDGSIERVGHVVERYA